MLFALFGIICGIIFGLIVGNIYIIDPTYSVYLYLLILALINSIFTLLAKKNIEEFKIKYCFIYIFVDIIIALTIGIIGERLGLPLYLAAVFAFGNNIYKNLMIIINQAIKKKII